MMVSQPNCPIFNIFFQTYRKVASTSLSHLEAHAGFFRFIVNFGEKVDFHYIIIR